MRVLRVILFLVCMLMFCYQTSKAINSYLNPPLVVVTTETELTDNLNPSVYICPLNQYNRSKLSDYGYDEEFSIVAGSLTNSRVHSWGAHTNLTFESLIRRVIDVSNEEMKINYDADPVLFPKFGFCYQNTNLSLRGMSLFPIKYDLRILVTDPRTKTFFNVDMSSQVGDIIRVTKFPKSTMYSFYGEIEILEAAKTSRCESDPRYSFEKCVDDYIHTDFIAKLGCVPPIFSAFNQCSIIQEINSFTREYLDVNYFADYFSLGQTIAERHCAKPCRRQKIKITLRDQSFFTHEESFATFAVNPVVKIYSEKNNYYWFNFVVDFGSAFGTWVGLSAISFIDFTRNPIQSIKNIYKWLRM